MIRRIMCFLLVPCFTTYLFTQNNTNKFFTTISFENPRGNIDGYTLYIPQNKKPQSYPLLVFLHGGLGTGGKITKVNEQPLPELIVQAQSRLTVRDQYLADSFVVACPHLSEGQFYQDPKAIEQIVAEISKRMEIDAGRIYLTGLSRGGHGTWGLGSKIPNLFAAIVPICGGDHGIDNYGKLAEVPIWTMHNTGDQVVSYNYTVKTVTAIEKLPGVDFLEIDDTDPSDDPYLKHKYIFSSFDLDHHDAWTSVYEGLEVYKWMLNQRK